MLERRVSLAILIAGLAAAAAALLAVVARPASGQSADIRPICNNVGFTIPAGVGQKVTIPTHQFAADPDVTPVKLVSVFGGSNLGTVAIAGNDLVFTRTKAVTGTVTLFWTITDGTLSAQCQASASNLPPPPSG
jgi:hypothetical protein